MHVKWGGTIAEYDELTLAINQHCLCIYDNMGLLSEKCAAHVMLDTNQRAVDGFLFARRIMRQLCYEEFDGE